MKSLLALSLMIAFALPAQAKVRSVVNCADEYTSVRINTTGEFGSDLYNVVIKDLRDGTEYPYQATLEDGSFVSAGNPTINTSPNSIAFVKEDWGLVVIEGENCEINLNP